MHSLSIFDSLLGGIVFNNQPLMLSIRVFGRRDYERVRIPNDIDISTIISLLFITYVCFIAML